MAEVALACPLAAAGLAPFDAHPGELREHAAFQPWPADEYRHVRKIADAGANNGKVFESVHLPTGNRCAVKMMSNSHVMREGLTEDAKVDMGVSSFLAQNRSAYVDLGKNLPASSQAYQDEKYTYLVSELVSGGDLFERVVAERRLDERTARKYAKQLIDGVASLHASGIAHRDISLENLLLGADDDVRIIDFGLAVPIPALDSADKRLRGAVGKPNYIAPEMFGDDYACRPVDAWAIGIAIFIMVSGRPPWIVASASGDQPEYRKYSVGRKLPMGGDQYFRYFLSNGLEGYMKWTGMEGLFSNELLDLLKKLLVENPQERMTIEAARMHPWFEEA